MHHSKKLAFTFIMMLVFFAVLFCLMITAPNIWPNSYYWPVVM